MQNLLHDLLWIIFPKLCACCDKALAKEEKAICTDCRFHLPFTQSHKYEDNAVIRRFWGKTNVKGAVSLLYYYEGEKVRQMIHQFKYHGYREVGTALGKMYGAELRNAEAFKSVDVIIPVP